MDIKILDSKYLKFSDSDVNELSAIAYKDEILYALSDSGVLCHFDIKIVDDKIEHLSLKETFKLKSKKSKRLSKNKRDSEGLAFMDNKLLISFERKPRVELFSLDAKHIKKIKIDKKLTDIKNYQGENKALESVAYNKTYGVLTAPESPLRNAKSDMHTIYGLNKKWEILMAGKITAMEFMNNDELMIMQRDVDFFAKQGTITISKLNLKNFEYKILATLESKKGWKIDNFEGLTKVDKNRYLIISDDNDSFLQKTLLVLFEVY